MIKDYQKKNTKGVICTRINEIIRFVEQKKKEPGAKPGPKIGSRRS
jgi:hypothetical protein